MRLYLLRITDNLANSFWFLPTAMAFIAALLALGAVALDHHIGSAWVRSIGWVWSGGAEGARAVLSVIAGSVMTVVSIVFSITVTTLAQVSSKFGPRILRNFTSDRGNQIVLGTFIATFVYCLLVLRTVRTVEELKFIPYIAVNIGLALAVAAIAVLIYFIHHITQSIQIEYIVAQIGNEFRRNLEALFPEPMGHGVKPQHSGSTGNHLTSDELKKIESEEYWRDAAPVAAPFDDYVQRTDDKRLLRLAREHDLQLRLAVRPGDFVTAGSPLLFCRPRDAQSSPKETRASANEKNDQPLDVQLCRCFVLGNYRSPAQDARYTMQQLVEIALRALSPGVNEPFTALTCLDWMRAILQGVARRENPASLRCDENGRVRIVAPITSFRELADVVFGPMRTYGANDPQIAARLLHSIAQLAPYLHRTSDCEALANHAKGIRESALAGSTLAADRARIENAGHTALHALATRESRKRNSFLFMPG